MVPYDERLGIHSQSERFTHLERWDFARTRPEEYPLLLHYPYFHLYRKQVIKQADVVLAFHLRGEAFSAEEKRRAFDYYEGLTVRDSSLSASTQAVMAAEVGHVDLAYDYLAESALIDLRDVKRNVRDGIHVGSCAGSWIAAVEGLGGMRARGAELSFAPRLPEGISGLRFRVSFRGRRIEVEVRADRARYRRLSGPPLAVHHFGEEVSLRNRAVSVPIPPAPALPRPSQPDGRSPDRRIDRLRRAGAKLAFPEDRPGDRAARPRPEDRRGTGSGPSPGE